MNDFHNKISGNKTLIIIPSQTRDTDLTYENFKKYLSNQIKQI